MSDLWRKQAPSPPWHRLPGCCWFSSCRLEPGRRSRSCSQRWSSRLLPTKFRIAISTCVYSKITPFSGILRQLQGSVDRHRLNTVD
jgi:hypothetical protein